MDEERFDKMRTYKPRNILKSRRLMDDPDLWPQPTHDSLRSKLQRITYPGYSYCLRCGMPWSRVEGHITHYGDAKPYFPRKGCFPLCEECWQLLGSPEARIEYYASLVNHWDKEGCSISDDEKRDLQRAVANGG